MIINDKILLNVLFSNNFLRTSLFNYVDYICESDEAKKLLRTVNRYYADRQKSLNVTPDDINAILCSDFESGSAEIALWQEIRDLNISDVDTVTEATIKYITRQLKEYFFAQAFTEDSYNLEKLEELYRLLDTVKNGEEDSAQVEDIELEDVDSCVSSYDNSKVEGVAFFDSRISDTLSAKQFDAGTINVICGSPGKGKTQLALNQGIYVAATGKHTLHIALGDLTKRQLLLRVLAIITNTPIQQISFLSPDQFKKFFLSAKAKYPEVFKHFHSKVCLPNVFTGFDIIRQIEDSQKKLNIHYDQVVVDYDGNIETDLSSTSKSRTRNDEQKSMYYAGADIYNSFSAFAKKNKSVTWILSQPKVQYWSVDKIPLEGLNDSSKKGHIIDFCMSIGKKASDDEDVVTLFISKNRHGENNKTFKSKQVGATQCFEPIVNNWN